MSSILDEFEIGGNEHFIWVVCAFAGLVIVIIAISNYIRILIHLHCIPISDVHRRIQPRHIRTYSTLSATSATLGIIFLFIAQPVCTQLSCWNTVLGSTISILIWDSYMSAKLYLYLIFIGRLFNPYYHQIYPYPALIRYLLWMLLIVLLIGILILNIDFVLLLCGIQSSAMIDSICAAVYIIVDISLSFSTVILFFRPLCSRRFRNSLPQHSDTSMVKKYGTISAMQLVAAVLFQISAVGERYLAVIEAARQTIVVYTELSRVVGMLDCLLLMICINIGFTRKQTVLF